MEKIKIALSMDIRRRTSRWNNVFFRTYFQKKKKEEIRVIFWEEEFTYEQLMYIEKLKAGDKIIIIADYDLNGRCTVR